MSDFTATLPVIPTFLTCLRNAEIATRSMEKEQ